MPGTQPRQILVVEDEAEMAAFLKERLESKGFQVALAQSGGEALAYLRDHHQPDLVILDVGLPDLSGYKVCEALRKLYESRRVPVLMLTAKDKPVDKVHGFEYGSDAYLTKPFDLAQLEQTVAMLLDRG